MIHPIDKQVTPNGREANGEAGSLRDARDYLTITQASHLLPGRPHVSTLHRWRLRGVRGVRLQTCLVGGRRYTTREWLVEFINATSGASPLSAEGAKNDRREAAIRAAEKELDDAGI